jgi:uncharacterized membrane protein YbhN (UPF0104 family)
MNTKDKPGTVDKTTVNYAVKLVITGLLFFFIFRSVDSSSTITALRDTPPLNLLAALLLQLASTSLGATRWYLIMSRIGFHHSWSFYITSYFKGTFFNQGLPTSIGGDGIRILDCSRGEDSAEDSFFGVFIDRIIGLAGLLLLNITALLINHSLLPMRVYYPLLIILTGLAAGLILLFFLRKFRFFSTGKYLGFLGRLSERYFQVYSSLSSISLQLGLSILIHLFAMTAFFMIGKGVGMPFSLQVYLALVPPVILLTILPISLAGWGVREGAMIGFFLLIGADKSMVLTLSILYGLISLVGSLPGLGIYLSQKTRL